MKAHQNEHIEDDFLKSEFKKKGLMVPSVDFSAHVMNQLDLQKSPKRSIQNKPIFSIKTWSITAVLIGVVFGLSTFSSDQSSYFDFQDKISLPNLSTFQIEMSTQMIYSVSIFAIFLFFNTIMIANRVKAK
jgi:hypothetical protein